MNHYYRFFHFHTLWSVGFGCNNQENGDRRIDDNRQLIGKDAVVPVALNLRSAIYFNGHPLHAKQLNSALLPGVS